MVFREFFCLPRVLELEMALEMALESKHESKQKRDLEKDLKRDLEMGVKKRNSAEGVGRNTLKTFLTKLIAHYLVVSG